MVVARALMELGPRTSLASDHSRRSGCSDRLHTAVLRPPPRGLLVAGCPGRPRIPIASLGGGGGPVGLGRCRMADRQPGCPGCGCTVPSLLSCHVCTILLDNMSSLFTPLSLQFLFSLSIRRFSSVPLIPLSSLLPPPSRPCGSGPSDQLHSASYERIGTAAQLSRREPGSGSPIASQSLGSPHYGIKSGCHTEDTIRRAFRRLLSIQIFKQEWLMQVFTHCPTFQAGLQVIGIGPSAPPPL